MTATRKSIDGKEVDWEEVKIVIFGTGIEWYKITVKRKA